MKWAVFSLSQMPDQTRRVEAFDEDLDYFVKAEELGYDTVWLAEHLFSTYGVVTSTQVYAAAVAQRTKRIKIGTAVVAIPFNHPLRTASDFALIDILSHGRLLFGVGRAYQPHEFAGLGVPMAEAREMMNEGVDIVLDAWTQEKVSRPDGSHWPIPDPVECLPKPVPPPAAASAGLSGVDLAGELHPGGGTRLPPATGLALHLSHLPGSVGREAPGEPRHLRGRLRGQRPRPEGRRAHDAHALFLP